MDHIHPQYVTHTIHTEVLNSVMEFIKDCYTSHEKSLHREISELRTEFKTEFQKHAKKINELTIDVSVIKQDIVGIKQDIVMVKQDIVGVKKDITGIKGDIVEIKNDIKEIKNMNKHILTLISYQEKRIKLLEKKALTS